MAVIGAVIGSRGRDPGETERQGVREGSGGLEVERVVVVSDMGAGLGNVNWVMNIASEVEKMCGRKATVVFYRPHEEARRFLSRFGEMEEIENLGMMRELGEGKVYIRRGPKIYKEEIEGLLRGYETVITFEAVEIHQEIRRSGFGKDGERWKRWSREIIKVEKYGDVGDWKEGVKMFLKDYNELYGSGVNESEGYARVWESPSEFSRRVEGGGRGEWTT